MTGATEREALAKLLGGEEYARGGGPAFSGRALHPSQAAAIADAILAEFMPDHDKRVRAEQRETDAHTVEKYQDKWWIAPDIAVAIRRASDD